LKASKLPSPTDIEGALDFEEEAVGAEVGGGEPSSSEPYAARREVIGREERERKGRKSRSRLADFERLKGVS